MLEEKHMHGRHEQQGGDNQGRAGPDPYLQRPVAPSGHEPQDQGHSHQADRQGQAGHVREQSQQDHGRKPRPLPPAQGLPVQAEQQVGQHHQGHEDIRHQLAGIPRDPGHERQAGAMQGQGQRSRGQAVAAQQKMDRPGGEQRLGHRRTPEVQPAERGQPEKEAVEKGTAGEELPFEDAAHVAAGIVEDHRVAVPQRRGEQQGEDRRQGRQPADQGGADRPGLGTCIGGTEGAIGLHG